MFKKKTEEKKQLSDTVKFEPRFVSKDEFLNALFVLKNAVESGQVASSLGPIPKTILVLPSSVVNSTYLSYGSYRLDGLEISEKDFKDKKEVVEEKRAKLENQLKAKREKVDKEIEELEKLSKELGELK